MSVALDLGVSPFADCDHLASPSIVVRTTPTASSTLALGSWERYKATTARDRALIQSPDLLREAIGRYRDPFKRVAGVVEVFPSNRPIA